MVRLTRKQVIIVERETAQARYEAAEAQGAGPFKNYKTFSIDWRLPGIVSPIITPEMGERIKNARMFFGWDQHTLGLKLGVKQHAVSNLERGQAIKKQICLSTFQNVFEEAIHYVLFASGADKYESNQVRRQYWDYRLKNRVNKKQPL